MRHFLFLLLLPLSGAVLAKDSPADGTGVVTRLYHDFGGDNAPSLADQKLLILNRYFTPELSSLLIEEGKRRDRYPGELGLLEFDPLSGSQDPDIHDLVFHVSGRQEVMALYRTSSGKKVVIRYHLRPAVDEWKIDDISYPASRCSLHHLLSRKFIPLQETFREPTLEAAPIKPLPTRASTPSHAEMARADALLNSEYRKLSQALGIDARERLTRAQRAWIRERDAFVAAHPLRHDEALLHATRQRIRELAAILAGPVLPAR